MTNETVDHLTGERTIQPDCVLDYNLIMGAVDKADMINSLVECSRKTTKWNKKKVFHLIDTAALNGHIVHHQLTGEMITEQGIFVIGRTVHIQIHYAIIVTISHPPTHCLPSSSPLPHR